MLREWPLESAAVPVRWLREAIEVPADLVRGRYPPFVTGGPLPRGHVPVFVFHSLVPETFERKLRYLAENGYRTLGVDEYVGVLRAAVPPPDRAVLLTFDDGRGSLWTVGGPLLRRYGMRGLVFLVPGRVPSRPGPLPPDWDDVQAGRASADAVRGHERTGGAFLSWEEIAALAESGVLEFQSHTLTHARIHTAPEVVGFLTPELRKGYAAMDVPLIADGERDLLAPEAPLGTPLLRSAPRTSEALRFREEPDVRRPAVSLVAAEGGEAFFSRAGWAARLRAAVPRAVPGRFESEGEREEAIRRELAGARALLEERLGRPVTHLCYPWHAAGPTARRLAREVGYETAFCGKVAGVTLSIPGGDLESIARIGEDWLELLPGQGRRSVMSVVRAKWVRRRRAV